MKALSCFVLLLLFAGSAVTNAQATKNGRELLFDGKTLNGWRAAQRDTLPEKPWHAENGVLTFDPAKGHGGDIVSTRAFTNFDLSVDFRVSKGGNSGIKYFLLPNTSLGCEFQILDDDRHPDAKLGLHGNRKTAAFYDVMPADSTKPYKPAGEWNTARIVVKGNHVEHWLNGVKVLAYERGSEEFKQAIAKSKFSQTQGFAGAVSSPILSQAHGDKVAFRNIKIKTL